MAALATATAPTSATVPEVKYEFNLSDFGGTLPLIGVRVHVDAAAGETFVLDGGTVRIFNASAMQTYSFGIDPTLGRPADLVVEPNGDVLVAANSADGLTLLRFDYRGVAKDVIVPMFPDDLKSFGANVAERGPDGLLYFLSIQGFRLVSIRPDGGFVRSYDLAEILNVKGEERGRLSLGGFGFDGRGNLLVTVTERFLAYVIAPDGTVREFGVAGSAAGRFGVIGAIAGDADGNIYIADRQRSVVLMFDANLDFVTEFGGYGNQPENLVRPDGIALAPEGRVLVAQMGQRGVSVFRLVLPQEVGGNP